MRLTITGLAVLLALPSPAQSQRIDMRVDDVAETADGYACRSHAYPELRLSHDWRGGARRAAWTSQARDNRTTDELRFNAAFTPSDEAPFGTASAVLGFQLDLSANPLPAMPKAAHLRVDGKPDATVLLLDGDTASLAVAVIERQRGPLAEQLMRAQILELDLVDEAGVPLRRYSWDVRSLRRAPELLQIINWSCQ